MKHDLEVANLNAQTLAVQVILSHVLSRVAALDETLAGAIRQGFDDAANDAENISIQLGKSTTPDDAVKTLGIIEYLRAATFGDQDKPIHVVYRLARFITCTGY
jgi:hypothetical protein